MKRLQELAPYRTVPEAIEMQFAAKIYGDRQAMAGEKLFDWGGENSGLRHAGR